MNPVTEKVYHSLKPTCSEFSKEKINSLLNEVNGLSAVEKMMFYCTLPTGVSRDTNKEPEQTTREEVTEAMNWIKTHLQPDKELCIAKQDVYDDYSLFCEKHHIRCVGREDLGKLMKTVYPTVIGRRLGTRGQTKHCYGGLTARTEFNTPSLPGIDIEPDIDNKQKEQQIINKTDLVKASCTLICQWAESILKQKFQTINDVAEYLVKESYVKCDSVAAYTVFSQMQNFKEINDSDDKTAKTTSKVLGRQSSSTSRNAKQQLHMKLQEKERWKEQQKRVEEQRCAITGETYKLEESGTSESNEGPQISQDASMSSDTTSNQGQTKSSEYRNVPVPKILPKPTVIDSTSQQQQQQLSSQAKPLIVMSPTQNSSGQYTPMILVSPMNTNQQILLPLTAAGVAGVVNKKQSSSSSSSSQQSSANSSSPTNALVTQLGLTKFSSSPATSPTSGNHLDKHSAKVTGMRNGAILKEEVNLSDQCNELLNAISSNSKKNSRFLNSDVDGGKEVSQNNVKSRTIANGKNIFIKSSNSKSEYSSDSSERGLFSNALRNTNSNTNTVNESSLSSNGVNISIKKEGEGNTAFVLNIPPFKNNPQSSNISDKDNIILPIQTLDAAAIAKLGIHDSSCDKNENSDSSNQESVYLTPTHFSSKTAGRKCNSKTVSSLLKEQRVKVDSPEIGKNRYVNDNRPVAQILKELREKKLQKSPQAGNVVQNLSFVERKIPKEINEQSVQILREKIAYEKDVMRRANALNYGTKSNNARNGPKNELTNLAKLQQSSGMTLTNMNKRNSQEGENAVLKPNPDQNNSKFLKLKNHEVALRNMLNEKRPESKDLNVGKSYNISNCIGNSQPNSVISSKKKKVPTATLR